MILEVKSGHKGVELRHRNKLLKLYINLLLKIWKNSNVFKSKSVSVDLRLFKIKSQGIWWGNNWVY